MELNESAPQERRETWRADVTLPLRWCRLPGLADAEALAEALGLAELHRGEMVLSHLDRDLQDCIDRMQDPAVGEGLRVLADAVRRLCVPADASERAVPTRMNLSADGISFEVSSSAAHFEPRDWLGVAITLPDGMPCMVCVEVIWVGDTDGKALVGGRFHHVQDHAARRLNRHMLLLSAH